MPSGQRGVIDKKFNYNNELAKFVDIYLISKHIDGVEEMSNTTIKFETGINAYHHLLRARGFMVINVFT
ncbi:hypothetical protein D1Z90_20160 [Motilimonas pumila]|uniref:Uncharacterized protein n=1 Tax=Motilimonas pumila TaxID=2303987 RepID=A0A418Y9A6_9GAMM|nr:hypothetical protein D1Z90_20160 [Motilimonas pumila]